MIKPNDIEIKHFPSFEPKGIRILARYRAYGEEIVLTEDIKNDPLLLCKVESMMKEKLIEMVIGKQTKLEDRATALWKEFLGLEVGLDNMANWLCNNKLRIQSILE